VATAAKLLWALNRSAAVFGSVRLCDGRKDFAPAKGRIIRRAPNDKIPLQTLDNIVNRC